MHLLYELVNTTIATGNWNRQCLPQAMLATDVFPNEVSGACSLWEEV